MYISETNASVIEVINKFEKELFKESSKCIDEISNISTSLEENWETNLLNKTSFILGINRARKALLLSTRVRSKNISHYKKYQTSSLFLQECHDYLTGDPKRNEQLHLVTGPITEDGIKVLSKMEKIKYEKQSSAYVRGDESDVHKRIFTLDEIYGHLVLAIFHSHISKGKNATSPSSIDLELLKRMESVGIKCVSGIFSLDGYIRLFSMNDFSIQVYGKGIELIEDESKRKIFKLSKV
jgi:hypothetical protein